jgi:hypothetical protein
MLKVAEKYSDDQIEELCHVILYHGARFRPSHLCLLLPVPADAAPDKLMDQAVRERWSVETLTSEVKAKLGQARRQAGSGRRPHVPADRTHKLHALESLTGKWLRWCEDARGGLPKEVQAAADEAKKAVENVRTAVRLGLT